MKKTRVIGSLLAVSSLVLPVATAAAVIAAEADDDAEDDAAQSLAARIAADATVKAAHARYSHAVKAYATCMRHHHHGSVTARRAACATKRKSVRVTRASYAKAVHDARVRLGGGSTPTPTPSPGAVSGTFLGKVSTLNPYGNTQVRITLSNSKISACTVVKYATVDISTFINKRAAPILCSEAIAGNSAKVAKVSGASYTSRAFVDSVADALAKAGR